jgi:hypothetical protein
LFFQYAASSPLVGGVGRDAAYIAEQIAAQESRKANGRQSPALAQTV